MRVKSQPRRRASLRYTIARLLREHGPLSMAELKRHIGYRARGRLTLFFDPQFVQSRGCSQALSDAIGALQLARIARMGEDGKLRLIRSGGPTTRDREEP